GINNLSIKKEFREHDWERNTLFVSQFLPYVRWNARHAMTRNKVVCGMSEAVIVIASGPERDSRGRMSGTFDAAKSAMEMNIPVFVLRPDVMDEPPKGNYDIIKHGGIEFRDGSDVLRTLKEATFANKSTRPTQLQR